MDEILAQLFPQAPSYFPGLLGQEQANLLQQQAQRQGLLGIGMGLLQAAAPSTTRPILGAGIAQGLATGQQMAQNVYAQKLQEQMIGQKLLEQQRLMREQEVARSLLPQILTPGQQIPTMYGQPSVFPQRDEDGNVLPGAGVQTGQPQINFNTLQALLTQAPGAAAQVLPIVKTFQELTKPEQFKLGPEETMFRRTPTGVQTVAVGGGKPEKPAGAVLEAMQVLGINTPLTELTPTQRTQIGDYIDRKEALKSPKVAVDLNDRTAVAKALSGIQNDYRAVTKDFGATDVSTRYLAAVDAVNQGNAGNKAADGALVYAIAKIYDPAGAVQEGDKSTIIGSRSVPETVKGYVQKLINGQSFLPEERRNLLAIVTQQVADRATMLENERSPYVELSKSLGGTGDLLKNPLSEALRLGAERIAKSQTIPGTNINVDALKAIGEAEQRRRRGQ